MASAPLTGIVLAAGQSTRMGRPKALLPCVPHSETFVARVVRTLREGGVPQVLVIGRRQDDELRRHVGAFEGRVQYVENPDPERGQLSSLVVGIDAAQAHGADAVMVLPVDMPQVRSASVAAVIAAWDDTSAPIARATHRGRHGHPVIFRKDVFADLRSADPRVGAKGVLQRHADGILNVEVEDPGVLRDFDVPEEYERTFGRLS